MKIVPVTVEPPGRPVLAEGEAAAKVRDYVASITAAAGLPPIHIAQDGSVEAVALAS